MSTALLSSPLQRVSLTTLISTAGLISLTVTGTVLFLPTAAALLVSGEGSPQTWTAILLPAAIWASGFTPPLRPVRPYVQAAAAVILLILGLLVSAGQWMPLTTIGFAAIVAAVFTLPARGAWAMILIVSALDVIAVLTDPPAFTEVVGFWPPLLASPLLNVLAGGGLVIAWHAWLARITEAEAEYEQVQRAAEQQQRDSIRLRAAEAVTRRIHETALNTLTAISMGVREDSIPAAREACQRDLEQMDLGLHPLPDSTVHDIVAAAHRTVPAVLVTLDLPSGADMTVSASIANPLRDAIVESLRNIERHSGVDRALVRVRVGAGLRVEVVDEGRGVAPDAEERFGLRNSVRSSMASIGGSAALHAPVSGGTVVVLNAPLDTPEPVTRLGLRTLRIVDSSRWARIGVTGTNLFMLLLLVPVTSFLGRPVLVSGLIAGYVLTIAVLALGWQRVPRGPLTLLALLLLAATFVAAASEPLTCDAVWSVNTLLAGMSGGAVLLPLLALSGTRSRLLFSIAVAAVSSLVLWSLPVGCTNRSALEFAVTTSYMVAFAFGLSWVEMVFERQRDAAQAQWNEVLSRELEREGSVAAESTWGILSASGRDLLEGIADGTVDLRSPDVAARAAVEADYLRSELGLTPPAPGPVGQLVRRMVRTAARTGATVEVELLTDFTREDAYPDEVARILDEVIVGQPRDHFILHGFADAGQEELVLVIPAGPDQHPASTVVGDTTVQVVPSDTDVHIMIRRPQA